MQKHTVFPQVIAGAIISILALKGVDYSRERDYSREAIISNISDRRWCPIHFVLFSQAIKEKVKYMNIAIGKTVKKNGAL